MWLQLGRICTCSHRRILLGQHQSRCSYKMDSPIQEKSSLVFGFLPPRCFEILATWLHHSANSGAKTEHASKGGYLLGGVRVGIKKPEILGDAEEHFGRVDVCPVPLQELSCCCDVFGDWLFREYVFPCGEGLLDVNWLAQYGQAKGAWLVEV